MKKVFVLMLGVILTFGVMAQKLSGDLKINQNDQNYNLVNVNLPADIQNATLFAPGDKHEEWINFAYYLCEATVGDAATNYYLHRASGILFPDTFVMIRYKNMTGPGFTYRNANWCTVGSILDPTSAILKMGSIDVKNNAAYTVDSIEIPYWYDRFSEPGVVDTLVIQMYKPANLSAYTYSTGANAGKKAFAVPKYSRSKKEGAMSDYRKEIYLKSTDTVTSKLGFIREAITGFNITNGGPVGITWTFKSGSKYSYLDTIPLAKWDSFQGVTKPLNAFYWLYYVDQSQEELFEYNNGVNVNSQQRYSDLIFSGQTTSIFPSTYLSFSMWTYPLYPEVSMRIKWTETVGINDLAKDVKVQLYPIPAEKSDNVTLDMTLAGKKNISIDVYDLLGHKVSSVTTGNYGAGKHSFSINTSTFDAGLYICNIIADGAVKTIKFEVR